MNASACGGSGALKEFFELGCVHFVIYWFLKFFEMWRHLETGLGIWWRVGGSGDREI